MRGNAVARACLSLGLPQPPTRLGQFFFSGTCLKQHVVYVCFAYIDYSKIFLFC